MIDQAEILEDDADAPAQPRVSGAVGGRSVVVEELDDATRRRLGKIDDLQQGRLAGPADTGQEIKPAGIELQRNVAQDFRIGAVTLTDMLKSDHARLRDSPVPDTDFLPGAGATFTRRKRCRPATETRRVQRFRDRAASTVPEPPLFSNSGGLSPPRRSAARQTGPSADRRTLPSAPA